MRRLGSSTCCEASCWGVSPAVAVTRDVPCRRQSCRRVARAPPKLAPARRPATTTATGLLRRRDARQGALPARSCEHACMVAIVCRARQTRTRDQRSALLNSPLASLGCTGISLAKASVVFLRRGRNRWPPPDACDVGARVCLLQVSMRASNQRISAARGQRPGARCRGPGCLHTPALLWRAPAGTRPGRRPGRRRRRRQLG